MNIAVYCSSWPNLDQRYHDIARALGRWIGRNGHTLVYGGVDAGLMHTVAAATKEMGGNVTGVITRKFMPLADPLVDQLITTADLSERKARMYLMSDLHVVLPGGVGTLDEWLSALSQMVVDKRQDVGMIIVNLQGQYDATMEQLRGFAQGPFAGDRHLALMCEVRDESHLLQALERLTCENVDSK